MSASDQLREPILGKYREPRHDTKCEFIIVLIVVDVGIYILNLSICNLKLLGRTRRESIYSPRKHLYL
jgi:hypothetical protein